MAEANVIVAEARRQQQITDKLIDQVSDAHSRAQNAVKDGNAILANAQATADTLKNFGQSVDSHRSEARQQMKRIPQIQNSIDALGKKSQQVRDLIGDAERKAEQSRDTAKLALRIAGQARDVRSLLTRLMYIYMLRERERDCKDCSGEGHRL